MTALPVKEVIPPEKALLFVQEVRDRCTIIMLTENDITRRSKRPTCGVLAAAIGVRIYNALLLRAAAKAKAETIYTWNPKHFRLTDMRLADRVRGDGFD